MIWNFIVIGAVVLIFLVLARRIPGAMEIKRKNEAETTPEKIMAISIISQADDAFEQKRYEQAEKLYIQAATQEPDNVKIYDRLGLIYLYQKNYYDAKEAFSQSSKLEPENSFPHENLGLAYLGLKDYFKACQSFQKAVELDPKNKNAQKYFERAKKFREREQSKIKR